MIKAFEGYKKCDEKLKQFKILKSNINSNSSLDGNINSILILLTTDHPILKAPFDELTIEMSNEIQSNIKDPSIRNWIIPNFTTTTESDKVVFSMALMSTTMKKYFNYEIVVPRVNGDSIPNGLVSTPMKLIQDEYNSTVIYSGHFGLKLLDNNSKSTPLLDWFRAVNDSPSITNNLKKIEK
ncbi:hypothetical protein ACTFIU_002203 [Dictyostelium citrinum]